MGRLYVPLVCKVTINLEHNLLCNCLLVLVIIEGSFIIDNYKDRKVCSDAYSSNQ